MEFFAKIVLGLALIVAIVFALLVLVTGKGDAMSGGGSVRTTFKGKASFDDIISKWTLYMGVSFMGLVLLYTVISNRVTAAAGMGMPVTPSNSAPDTNAANTPAATPEANKPAEASNTPAPEAKVPEAKAPEANAPDKK